jgi:hypothetical protein
LRQAQFVDATAMVDLQFAHLPEQILAIDAGNRGAISCSGWLVATFITVLDQLAHLNLLLNANNSYLDYSSFDPRLQALLYFVASFFDLWSRQCCIIVAKSCQNEKSPGSRALAGLSGVT